MSDGVQDRNLLEIRQTPRRSPPRVFARGRRIFSRTPPYYKHVQGLRVPLGVVLNPGPFVESSSQLGRAAQTSQMQANLISQFLIAKVLPGSLPFQQFVFGYIAMICGNEFCRRNPVSSDIRGNHGAEKIPAVFDEPCLYCNIILQ